MPVCSINNAQTSLVLTDTPMEYTPPFGPGISLKLKYFQRNTAQPANFTISNIGPMWSYNWMAYIQDDPNSPGIAVSLYARDGGFTACSGYNSADGTFAPEQYAQAQLVKTSTSPVTYERRLKNGSKEVYSQSNGATVAPRTIFLTSIVDPFGNAVTLTYDSQNRLTRVNDALNQQTTFSYANSNPLLITTVTDPIGRNVTLAYDSVGRLASLTDVIGMTTTFAYDSGTFITSMTTPYGTTQYASSQAGYHWTLTTTDPLGYSDRQEFLHAAAGIPFSETLLPANTITSIYNAYINYRDSYYWDKAVVQAMGSTVDYTKARITHWEHLYNDFSYSTPVPIPESTKAPLENRVWYFYAGQPNSIMAGPSAQPNQIARVLDDGTTQSFNDTYNAQGNTLSHTDPANRGTLYDYASNGIDVTQVRRVVGSQTDVLAKYTYNSQHLPLTYIDAAGQTTTYSYNSRGQIASVKDAKNNTTTYQYSSAGYLTTILNANSVTQHSYTYDAIGRVATETDSEGYVLSYHYDALNRRTSTTFPDGTQNTLVWNKLDLASKTNRLGQIVQYAYDGVRNRTSETDALGNVTRFGYDPAGRLTSQNDANGHQTTWVRDIEGRVISKTYPTGDTYRYAYDSAGRLLSRTDPLGQTKTIAYTIDDQPKGYSYTNAVNATPAVAISYDPLYPRPITVQDGTGTTVLKYVPAGTLGAGQISEQDSPDGGSAVIKNTYDPLGRVSTRTIGSAIETLTYDTLGRVASDQSTLGTFQYSFLGQSAQVSAEVLQGNTWQSAYAYGTNVQDRQLQSITHPSTTSAPNIGYTTGPENQILTRTDAQSLQTSPYDANASYVVDGDNQIQSANTVAWIYDANGNVLDDGTNTYQWDAENRLNFITNKTSGHISQFKYDGFSRRTAIIEKANATATPVETHYLWCGSAPCESHTATGQQLTLYFRQGEIATGSNAPHYYARDSLGSVMQVVDANGTLLGGAQYTNYGTVVLASGAVPTFGYAGMFQHAPSLTNLTLYRVYSPTAERWLSRDPIEELGGRNLYAYAKGSPVRFTDPLGLCPPNDSYTIPGSGVIPPGAPPLTDAQIEAALENLAQQQDFLNQAAIDWSVANMNPTPQNWAKYNEDMASARRYYDRYANIIDNPGSKP
jgi:RHS repeat-associated protein